MLSSDYIMLNIATLYAMSTLWFIEQFHSHSCLYKGRAGVTSSIRMLLLRSREENFCIIGNIGFIAGI